ncbi:MAG: ribulose-phosphate 3-epimerase [Spirochaetes bacterium]|nr:MAG: ribulose-phosphate 3-epimerase [Spirochaetota bacterium]
MGKISPSMMCADFMNLGRVIEIFEKTGVDYLHIDIMDGHYVPNLTFGVDFCKALYENTSIPLDIHLMVEKPLFFAEIFSRFKGSIISFHPEVDYHPIRTIEIIKNSGCRAGIAIDPALPVSNFVHLFPQLDMVCIMTVNPGYSGQKLLPFCIDKIKETAGIVKDKRFNLEIEVDGNVSWKNLPVMMDAGADIFVAGTSSIFADGQDLEEAIKRFKRIIGGTDG